MTAFRMHMQEPRAPSARSTGKLMSVLFPALTALVSLSIGSLVTATTSLAATAASVDAPVEEQALTLMNSERVAAALPEFQRTAERDEVARARALDMATSGYFAHISPSGVDAAALLADHGIAFVAVAENIGRATYARDDVAGVVHRAWMASAGHRTNMLEGRHLQVGIGVAQVDGMFYFVVVFTD